MFNNTNIVHDCESFANLKSQYYSELQFVDKCGTPRPNDEHVISILHVNARSPSKNVESIISMLCSLNNYNFTFIAVTETWLHDISNINVYNIDGYNLIHKDRPDKRGGGVAIYVLNGVDYQLRNDLSTYLSPSEAESLFIEVKHINSVTNIIGVIYQSTRFSISYF